jgi:hypothetical protein
MHYARYCQVKAKGALRRVSAPVADCLFTETGLFYVMPRVDKGYGEKIFQDLGETATLGAKIGAVPAREMVFLGLS